MRTRYLLAGLLSLALAACSSGATPAPSVEPMAQPAVAEASPSPKPPEAAAPSPAPTPTTAVLEVKVTFDGETCTYLGPSVIPDGTVLRFEYVPDQEVAGSWLIVYGVKPGTTFEDLLESLLGDDGNVRTDIPDWVYQETASSILGAGAMLYPVESLKRGQDGVDYEVGGYQVMCDTPAGYPAAQLTVAGA